MVTPSQIWEFGCALRFQCGPRCSSAPNDALLLCGGNSRPLVRKTSQNAKPSQVFFFRSCLTIQSTGLAPAWLRRASFHSCPASSLCRKPVTSNVRHSSNTNAAAFAVRTDPSPVFWKRWSRLRKSGNSAVHFVSNAGRAARPHRTMRGSFAGETPGCSFAKSRKIQNLPRLAFFVHA